MGIRLASKPKGRIVLYFPVVWMPQWPMWAPLCMYTLETALLHEGFEVTLIDERVDPDPRGWLEKELEGALFVGIPGKSGGQCRNMEAAAAFVKSRRPDLPVVAGGWFPSLFPHQTITSKNIDIVVIGPADHALPEIANRLLEKKSLEGVDNVFFKEEERTVKNRVNRLPRLEKTHPIPWELVGIRRYIHPHGWINYFTSRGCPGGCTFCSVYCLDPRRWTALPPERVIEDLEILVGRIGARAFQIVDTDFCADLKRVERICELILARKLKIRFHVLGRHHTLCRMSPAQRRLLRRAGCTEIEVGLETGSQRLADWIGKQVDVSRFVDTIRGFVGDGIRMRVNIMLGLPHETGNDLVNTFLRMLELRKLGEGVRFQMFRFTPLPDSEMGRSVWGMKTHDNQGRVPETYEELLDFKVNDEPIEMFWLSKKHERDVKRAYAFYAPLLCYQGALEVAGRRAWWRPVLRRFMPIAEWRVRTGFYCFPIEMWLNRIFGSPMPLGADSGVPPPEDVLPEPEMGEALDERPPLDRKGRRPWNRLVAAGRAGATEKAYCVEDSRGEPCPMRCDASLPSMDGTPIELEALPQPLHLYEFLTRSGHYHFGCGRERGDSLAASMDRLVVRCLDLFAPQGAVLDVGCGMGGTALLMADRGFTVFGIDPCRRAVAFATKGREGRKNVGFAVLAIQDLVSRFDQEDPGFDGIMMTEVLQHFPSLEDLFRDASKLIRPGGMVVLNDVMTTRVLERDKVPFHHGEAVESAAAAAGFTILRHEVITEEVRPTLERMIEALEGSRASILSHFRDPRPGVEQEMAELIHQWKQLDTGFALGDLTYESMALRLERRAF